MKIALEKGYDGPNDYDEPDICDQVTKPLGVDESAHTGEKSHTCSLCSYASTLACNLKTHLKGHIGGKKSEKCKLCNFATSREKGLIDHMKSHSGDKPYHSGLARGG